MFTYVFSLKSVHLAFNPRNLESNPQTHMNEKWAMQNTVCLTDARTKRSFVQFVQACTLLINMLSAKKTLQLNVLANIMRAFSAIHCSQIKKQDEAQNVSVG